MEVIKPKKEYYTQNWPAYDKAQCSEKTLIMPLLAELCRGVEQEAQEFGRPKNPISDMIFSSVMKIYSSKSLRRFMGELKNANEQELIGKIPCFAAIGHFMQRTDITPILYGLVVKSSLPLRSIEKDFAADSSGFSTCRFRRWFDFKYGKERDFRIWIKSHLMCGVKTNIVTSVRLSEATGGDSPYFKILLNETSTNFNINEVSADKTYSSRKNLEAVNELGGTPFIPFRKGTGARPKSYPTWKRMYHYFMLNQEEFMRHYHKRSNVETTFHMIKTKFGDSLKSKTKEAQINEVLCKIICHNLCVLIHELHELRF